MSFQTPSSRSVDGVVENCHIVLPERFLSVHGGQILAERFDKIGRGDWIRTSDPLLPKQVRYQAAPLPELALRYTLAPA